MNSANVGSSRGASDNLSLIPPLLSSGIASYPQRQVQVQMLDPEAELNPGNKGVLHSP